MHARDNAYSRFIGRAKVLLPLVGLVLLSTLFLIARAPQGPGDIPFAEIEAIANEQRVSAPRFAGIADNGASISVEAATVRPQSEGVYAIDAPHGVVDTPDGARIEMRAASGAIVAATRQLRFNVPVRVETSMGYSVETPALEADLGTGGVVSTGAITVDGPFGRFTAGEMRTELPEETAPRMVFSGGVRLLYDPSSRGESP